MDSRLNKYRAVETLGKSQLDLVIQVYDGTIAAFRAAAEHYQKKNYQAGYEQLEKARRFLTHLYTTLDSEKGGSIAENLGKLYAYLINQINVAEATKDLAIIDDNVNMLSSIREGWRGLKGHEAKVPAVSESTASTLSPKRLTELA